ncbi:MAG: hypothetical protein EXQ87_08720 [Alphaproteobacteria bacterium]|nr:hypothetical protein [Alphaproteobacteria bacterium]
MKSVQIDYAGLSAGKKAFATDILALIELKAIELNQENPTQQIGSEFPSLFIAARLEWATEITETEFLVRISTLPPAKTRLPRG